MRDNRNSTQPELLATDSGMQLCIPRSRNDEDNDLAIWRATSAQRAQRDCQGLLSGERAVIKAKAKDERGQPPLLFFGLSEEDLRRLRLAQVIEINLAEMGLEGIAVIFYGKTDEHIQKLLLTKGGLLSEDPTVHEPRGTQ